MISGNNQPVVNVLKITILVFLFAACLTLGQAQNSSDVKRILLFGDSNTWGFIPVTAKRYPRDVRWSGVLAKELGTGYEVIEEGLTC